MAEKDIVYIPSKYIAALYNLYSEDINRKYLTLADINAICQLTKNIYNKNRIYNKIEIVSGPFYMRKINGVKVASDTQSDEYRLATGMFVKNTNFNSLSTLYKNSISQFLITVNDLKNQQYKLLYEKANATLSMLSEQKYKKLLWNNFDSSTDIQRKNVLNNFVFELLQISNPKAFENAYKNVDESLSNYFSLQSFKVLRPNTINDENNIPPKNVFLNAFKSAVAEFDKTTITLINNKFANEFTKHLSECNSVELANKQENL